MQGKSCGVIYCLFCFIYCFFLDQSTYRIWLVCAQRYFPPKTFAHQAARFGYGMAVNADGSGQGQEMKIDQAPSSCISFTI